MSRTFCCLLIAVLSMPSVCRADSIWQRRDYFSAFLFEDTRARRVGDLVTIAISQATDVQNSDQQNLSKTNSNSGILNFAGSAAGAANVSSSGGGGSAGSGPSGTLSLNVSNSNQRAFNGSSTYNVNQQFLDHMEATVIAVQTNGNLIIEGSRKTLVGTEWRTLCVRGVIRPIDIGAANTISSQNIAVLQLFYQGKGPQTLFTQPGWLSKKLNQLWPF